LKKRAAESATSKQIFLHLKRLFFFKKSWFYACISVIAGLYYLNKILSFFEKNPTIYCGKRRKEVMFNVFRITEAYIA
jgi:hypothetical protein